ncbi:hypothetical protein AAG906_021857 [Vitis piasezkii]
MIFRISIEGYLWKAIRCGWKGIYDSIGFRVGDGKKSPVSSRQINDWELGEVEGLLRRLQGLLSKGFHKLGVEPLACCSQLFWLYLMFGGDAVLNQGCPH